MFVWNRPAQRCCAFRVWEWNKPSSGQDHPPSKHYFGFKSEIIQLRDNGIYNDVHFSRNLLVSKKKWSTQPQTSSKDASAPICLNNSVGTIQKVDWQKDQQISLTGNTACYGVVPSLHFECAQWFLPILVSFHLGEEITLCFERVDTVGSWFKGCGKFFLF